MKFFTSVKNFSKGIVSRLAQISPWKSLLYIVAIGLIFLALLGAVRFGGLLAFFIVVEIIAAKLRESLDINPWLLNFVAIILTAILMFTFVWMLSFKKNIRRRGYITFFSFILLGCLGMFWVTKDDYFSHKTGKAALFVPLNANGEVVNVSGEVPNYHTPGFCTRTGYSLVALTPELLKKIKESNFCLANNRTDLKLNYALASPQAMEGDGPYKIERDPKVFFDANDGHPLYYYALYNDRVEIWSGPGYHPLTGEKLKEINTEIVLKWESQS